MFAKLVRILVASPLIALIISACATVEAAPAQHPYVTVLESYAAAIRNGDAAAMEAETLGHSRLTTITYLSASGSWSADLDDDPVPELRDDSFELTDFQIANVEPHDGSDLGYALFTFTITGRMNDEAYAREGAGTVVFESTSAGWKICHLQTS